MSFLDAALAILRVERRPMTARELAEAAIDRGMVRSTGKTPESTLTAQLYVCVREDPEGPLRKVAVPGAQRAVRGSVRWEWVGD